MRNTRLEYDGGSLSDSKLDRWSAAPVSGTSWEEPAKWKKIARLSKRAGLSNLRFKGEGKASSRSGTMKAAGTCRER
jgi:hypothetical protein